MSAKERTEIAPGIWMEGEEMHFDPEPFLKVHGLPDTIPNRNNAIEAFKQWARDNEPSAPIVDLFDREPPPDEAA